MVDLKLVPQYDEKAFSADVIARWGEREPGLQQMADLLHVQMGELAALCHNVPELVEEIFWFLDEVVIRPDAIPEIANAVAISFVEWPDAQEFAKTRSLPQGILTIIREHW